MSISLDTPSGNDWEIGGRFKVIDINTTSYIIDCNPDSSSLRFAYKNDGASLYCFSFLVSVGTYWITAPSYKTSALYTEGNVWVYFKVGFNTTERYYVKLSDDGITFDKTWFNNNTYQYARFSSSGIIKLGGINNEIDMKEFYYKKANELIWQGVK